MLLAAPAVRATTMPEAEAAIAAAYADYRAALFRSNQNDRAGTEAAIDAFAAAWARLAEAWRSAPPPQYAADPRFPETVATIARIAAEARARAATDLAAAHDALEAIRDELGRLRARNGVVVFSDHVNAYHEAMEHVLTAAYGGLDAAGIEALRDDAAVLVHLARRMGEARPAGADPAAFEQLFAPVRASAEALLAAARARDREAILRARAALKPPFSRLFLRFG
jgi:hypothetical protein